MNSVTERLKLGFVFALETAAIVRLCGIINKPLVIIKSVPDIVDGSIERGIEFEKNFELTVSNLTSRLIQLIGFLKK